MPLFDTHTHLNLRDFSPDVEEVIHRAQRVGVERFLCAGFNFRTSAEAVSLAEKKAFIYASVGVHPHDAKTVMDGDYSFLEKLLLSKKVVAWGEIGLDFFRDLSPRQVQAMIFREQIAIARSHKFPLIIHDRDAHGQIISILQEEKAEECGGIMHCFSASWREAKKALDLGFFISFAGNLTYPSARSIQEAAVKIPLERLLVETDCPYLKPFPDRRGRNEPACVRSILQFLADLRGMSVEDLSPCLWANSLRAFHLS